MAFPVLNLIADFWYTIFGNALIFTAVLIFFLVIAMFVLRANITVILIVIIPLITGVVLNTAGSNLLSIATWITPVIWIIAGLMFSLFFLWLVK